MKIEIDIDDKMEENKTIFNNISQIFATFGIIVLMFVILGSMMDEEYAISSEKYLFFCSYNFGNGLFLLCLFMVSGIKCKSLDRIYVVLFSMYNNQYCHWQDKGKG